MRRTWKKSSSKLKRARLNKFKVTKKIKRKSNQKLRKPERSLKI